MHLSILLNCCQGYGFAQLPDIKADPDTLYYTGSTTKSFTAAAVSLLIDDSADSKHPLQWSTPISSLIPDDFVLLDTYATHHLTLEDAMSHRTGMPRHDGVLFATRTPRDVVRSLRFLPMSAELRTTYQYCNLMFIVASHVIETITGSFLGDVLRTRIWEPLGMRETYFSLSDAKKAVTENGKTLARGYYWEEHVQRYLPEPYWDWPAISGAGNIISSVNDYAHYLRAMMDEAPPISSAGHAALRTPRTIVSRELYPKTGTATYSLGWGQRQWQGESLMVHDGGLTGFGTRMLYMPWRKWAVVMMGNTAETSNAAEQVLSFRLIDELLQTPIDQRINWIDALDRQLAQSAAPQDVAQARKLLFPDAPQPEDAIPPSLEPKEYVGSYTHPAYGTFDIKLRDPDGPDAKVANSSWSFDATLDSPNIPYVLELEHVNVDYFIALGKSIKADNSTPVGTVSQAEFVLQANGQVKELGVRFEQAIPDLIWFQKVA